VKYFLTVNGREREVELTERAGRVELSLDGQAVEVDYREVDQLGQVFASKTSASARRTPPSARAAPPAARSRP
jgi:hypothetical protein